MTGTKSTNIYSVYVHISIIYCLFNLKDYCSPLVILYELYRLTFQFCSLLLQMDILVIKHYGI